MSRSNHFYYNVCDDCNAGTCTWHGRQPDGPRWHFWKGPMPSRRKPEREILGRRNWRRRKRFRSHWTWKAYCCGPPMSIKRIWSRGLRARYAAELHRHPDDPVLVHGAKLLAGWYQNWA